MNVSEALLAGVSILLAAQAGYSAVLMLYSWEDDDKLRQNRVPESFEPPKKRFTLLLPARHEEAVIKDTIQRLVELNYPRKLVQILVVVEAGDQGTIAEVDATLSALRKQGVRNVRLIT